MKRWEYLDYRWRRSDAAHALHWHQLPEWAQTEILEQDAARLNIRIAIGVAMALLTLAVICWPT